MADGVREKSHHIARGLRVRLSQEKYGRSDLHGHDEGRIDKEKAAGEHDACRKAIVRVL